MPTVPQAITARRISQADEHIRTAMRSLMYAQGHSVSSSPVERGEFSAATHGACPFCGARITVAICYTGGVEVLGDAMVKPCPGKREG